MNTIVVGNWNNYYNRIKKEPRATISDYENVGAPISEDRMWDCCEFSNINFVKNDGVNTTLTINVKATGTEPTVVVNPHKENLSPADISPDYLLVCDSNGNVVSRWFIIESHWNREWQFLLTLRRDLITDFWDAFKDKDFYCEKGPIPSGYGVLKYTSEGQTFNSILKSGKRTMLYPESGVTDRYIVGYLDRGWAGGTVYNTSGSIYAEYESMDEFPLKKYMSGGRILYDESTAEYGVYITLVQSNMDTSGSGVYNGPIKTCYIGLNMSSTITDKTQTEGVSAIGSSTIGANVTGSNIESILSSDVKDSIIRAIKNTGMDEQNGIYTPVTPDILAWDGRHIKVGDKVYYVGISAGGGSPYVSDVLGDVYLNPILNAVRYYNGLGNSIWTTGQRNSYAGAYCKFIFYEVDLVESTGITFPGSRSHPGNGLPYDIFTIKDGPTARGFISNFLNQYPGVIYDCQLLPFKPDTTGSTGNVTISGSVVIKWATSDHVSGHFKHAKIKTYSGDTEYKTGSNLDMCRLYSPDGAACWEFNPAKIGGVAADSIRYEVTFAPLAPYMHIFPTFGGIYGSENKTDNATPNQGESRGLVCSGDYSLPYSTSNWAQYKINNAAFQLAHDRMITNMSIMQNAERLQENVNILFGSISGGAFGAQSGAMMGGGYGAAIGGAIGLAGSSIAGIAARDVNERLRAEELSYAEDMFGYNLKSIQAQPQPLAHSNYLTVGAATFPYIELYEADSKEEEIFQNRLRVNGWTIGAVTTMATMKTAATASGAPTRFVKGRLVMLGGQEDAHVAAEIDRELQRGVRFLES